MVRKVRRVVDGVTEYIETTAGIVHYDDEKKKSVKDKLDEIGDLDKLATQSRDNIVNAINEIYFSGGSGGSAIPSDINEKLSYLLKRIQELESELATIKKSVIWEDRDV